MDSTLMRSYSELIKMDSYRDRFEYLKLNGAVCEDTFGFDRYLNQVFYRSPEWRRLRNDIIIRDYGCDLAHSDYEIQGKIYIHHMNPISKNSIIIRDEDILNAEYLVCTSFATHQAIHYGKYEDICQEIIERRPGDTCPWKHRG